MLQELKNLIQSANNTYDVFYEESRMFNVDADELQLSCNFCHIEEFVQGTITNEGYIRDTATAQIYFFKICEMQNTAEEREETREEIKQEIVYPFLDLIKSDRMNQIRNAKWFYPISKYDCNEVGVMLEFEFKIAVCSVGS